jgi:hypothetical protein
MKQQDTPDQVEPVTGTVDSLTQRCRECGQTMPEKTVRYLARYNLNKNVFVWSFMTLFFWGIALSLPPQWTVAWWEKRTHVMLPLVVMPAVAIYFWAQFLRERRKK